MNEFKTSDVVAHPKYGCGIVQDVGWVVFGDDADSAVLSDVADDLSLLVVIDPEDHAQVLRLAEKRHSAVGFARWDALHPGTRRDLTDAMQAALREFANPKPTKPEEPLGIGAVVEDSSGYKWVRARFHDTDDTWWRCSRWGGWAAWADIDAVRRLSEGVQESPSPEMSNHVARQD